jgi:Carboxypeptidase regulatory-like domain
MVFRSSRSPRAHRLLWSSRLNRDRCSVTGRVEQEPLAWHEETSDAGQHSVGNLHQLDRHPVSHPDDSSESRRRACEGLSAVRRVVPGLLLMVLMAGWTGQSFAIPAAAMISGTVRDVHGTPQMGALVQLLRADASTAATAISDDHGRYIMPMIMPGRYEIHATAAFFAPLLRSNVRLRPGMQSVVNLTLSALFEADNWLPAQRRRADEPVDDWKWTLRSTASRPLLRLVDPEDGTGISSSGEQSHRVSSEGRIIVTNGDGAFGDGGMHQALVLDRTMADGDGAVLRADVGNAQGTYSPGPSVAVITGYERRTPLGGSTRLVGSFQSHPEVMNGDSTTGLQVVHLASTQQFALGDTFLIDAGTLMEAERLEETRLVAEPFFRLAARPGTNVVVEYRLATGRELQSSDDLDQLKPTLTAVADANGRPLSDRGMHQEISVSRKLGDRAVSASAYIDHFSYSAIGGSGLMDRATLQMAAVLADPTTGTFQVAAPGYSGRGVSASFMQPITPVLSAWLEYDLGTALRSNGNLVMTDLASGMTPEVSQAAGLSLRGKIIHTGTSLRVKYRWQPVRTLTQVNAYNATPEEAYLSFYLRQRLWCGRILPQGLDAVVEATNLLEQGYQPVLAPDGQTLMLAQVPRAIQAGLSFNF